MRRKLIGGEPTTGYFFSSFGFRRVNLRKFTQESRFPFVFCFFLLPFCENERGQAVRSRVMTRVGGVGDKREEGGLRCSLLIGYIPFGAKVVPIISFFFVSCFRKKIKILEV